MTSFAKSMVAAFMVLGPLESHFVPWEHQEDASAVVRTVTNGSRLLGVESGAPVSRLSLVSNKGTQQTQRGATWRDTKRQLLKVVRQIDDDRDSKEVVRRLSAATSELEMHDALKPLALLSLSVNPESRVKIDALQDRVALRQNEPNRFLVRVENIAGITAPLNLSAIDLALEPPAAADWCNVEVVDDSLISRELSGAESEYKVMVITPRTSGLREVRLVADAGQGTQDLGFRATASVLLKIEPKEKSENE